MIDANFHIFTSRQVFVPTGGTFDSTPNHVAGHIDLDREEGTSFQPETDQGLATPEFDAAFQELSAYQITDRSDSRGVHAREDSQQTDQVIASLYSRRASDKVHTDLADNTRLLILKTV